jgi:hypothetical protein
VVDHEGRHPVHIRVHRVTEQQQLYDRRCKHDPLGLGIAEDLAQFLAQ